MHANNINDHQKLTHQASEIATAWQGTDPMQTEDGVRRALIAADTNPSELDALLPYVIDACREAGLLID